MARNRKSKRPRNLVKNVIVKPSKSALRVLTILGYIEATTIVIKEHHADPIIAGKVDYVGRMCREVYTSWEVIGDKDLVAAALIENIAKVHIKLEEIWWLKLQPTMNYPSVCYIGLQLLDDLMRLIPDKKKTIMLQNVYDGMEMLINHVDPNGLMFLTQERATEVVDAIYSVVGES